MDNSKIALAALVILFGMLWAPLGQYDFLVQNWMKLGTYGAPVILFVFFSVRTEQIKLNLTNIPLMSVVFLVAYIIHQFEEHWIDLRGEQYAFYKDVNQLLLGVLNAPDSTVMPLTPASIYMINTALVWLIGSLAIWRSSKQLFPTLALAGITLVNGMGHLVLGITKQAYNPGLLTAIVIFLPLAIAFYRAILTEIPENKKLVIASIIWSVLAHVIMLAGVLTVWYQLISETTYFAILIIWSILPVFLFNSERTTESS